VQLKAAEAALKERGRHVTQLEQSVRTLTRQLDASGAQIDTLQVLLNGSLNGAIQISKLLNQYHFHDSVACICGIFFGG
jgi:hypothetical protein